ncbi:MAG: hypothetical protein JO276_17230 [Sphingomonadaceae bacterium]|nr:hypothetical protein [Sphingomonadaceae bacterium]
MMRFATIGLCVCSALALAASPAFAQYGMPTPTPPQQSMSDQGSHAAPTEAAPATAPELVAAASCLIGHNAAAADRLFATAPFSPAERQIAVRLLSDMQRCTHHAPMSTSAALIRGALAEAALEARFAAPQAAHDPAVDSAPLFRADQATAIGDAASFAPAYALAECTSRQHPELVRALLATEPASAEAGTAFNALNPAFIACVTPGARLNVDGRMLRGLLAETLYRWSVVQRDGPTSPWAAAPATAQASPAPTQPATTGASH